MEANDIKNIWKTGIEANMKPYSEEELTEMVVKSARRSIKAIYPGRIYRLVIITVLIGLIAMPFLRKQGTGAITINAAAFVILSVSYFFWERSAFRMREYIHGKPVKEWLEFRIKEIEKSVTFNAKYNWIIYGVASLVAIGFYVSYQIATDITPNALSLVIISVGLAVYLLIRKRSSNRNYRKALHELKDLYGQFEDSNQ